MPELASGVLHYIQETDSCDEGADQELVVHAVDAGGGKYWVIETQRWAFNNIEEFAALLRDAGCRLGIEATVAVPTRVAPS